MMFLLWMYSNPDIRHAMKKPIRYLNIIITSLLLCEPSIFANMEAQVTPRKQVHDQVHVISILKGVVHVDNEGIVQLREYLAFVHDRFETSLGENASFRHFLHCVLLLGLFPLYFPNLTEPPFSNAVGIGKAAFGHGCIRLVMSEIPMRLSAASNSGLK